MNFDSIGKVEEFLANIPKFQSEGATAAHFGLSRFRRFCSAMGNPQNTFPAIHVAGTNGKGSTCRILGSVYKESGYKTGVYTSPHIFRFGERFKINGQTISDVRILSFFEEYGRKIKEFNLSYFEISTAVAFWWFSKEEVDLAIIETGLGGRLDATNVIDPLVSVITSVSLDHTNILGNTIEEITREKAGIIKDDTPVITGDLPKSAAKIIAQVAEQKGSTVSTIDRLNPKYLKPGVYQINDRGESLTISSTLNEPVQAINLAIALLTTKLTSGKPVSTDQFVRAVRYVDLGGVRFSRLLENHPWYFDGGHNIEAVKALKQAIQTRGSVGRAVIVLALMRDKIRPELMAEFSEFKKIYYYPLDSKRAATFGEIQKWLPQANLFPSNRNRQQLFFKDIDSELVIFAGSFYFYTTVQDWIRNYT